MKRGLCVLVTLSNHAQTDEQIANGSGMYCGVLSCCHLATARPHPRLRFRPSAPHCACARMYVSMYVWDMDSRGPNETHIRWFQIPHERWLFLKDDMPMPTRCPLKNIESMGRENEDGCDGGDAGCRYHCRSNFFQSE